MQETITEFSKEDFIVFCMVIDVSIDDDSQVAPQDLIELRFSYNSQIKKIIRQYEDYQYKIDGDHIIIWCPAKTDNKVRREFFFKIMSENERLNLMVLKDKTIGCKISIGVDCSRFLVERKYENKIYNKKLLGMDMTGIAFREAEELARKCKEFNAKILISQYAVNYFKQENPRPIKEKKFAYDSPFEDLYTIG